MKWRSSTIMQGLPLWARKKYMSLFSNRPGKPQQYLFSLVLIACVASVCFVFKQLIDYRVVAFILLVCVSLVAMKMDILPVFVTAITSAVVWDFFFIPPRFTFSIGSTEDRLMLLMYLLIATIHAVLTYKMRQVEKAFQVREGKANTIRLYNTLLNSLSHELRTPISAIIGATDNLQSNGENLTEENKLELLGEISKASFRLNQQVENLLNMSRLESGSIRPKNDWCDINELIYQVMKEIEENHFSQRFLINVDPEIPLFKLDAGMLEQVLYNLLMNAGRYTPVNSTIRISAAAKDGRLELQIEDNGKGFPEEEIAKVFDKFYRLTNSGSIGTGLGLSIVKGFTEALNGTVRLENIGTGGAKFVISIQAETSYLDDLNNG
ncbi:MAG: histidine kinase [Ferruginibacter sp.]|nr:histidine kinase [Ferruginibacter sp.]